MIHINRIFKSFGHGKAAAEVLHGISLDIQDGEIFGIIGYSGAGKSTLLRCINMLERPDSGSVCMDGQELTGLSEKRLQAVRQETGMIFQHFNLLSSANVFDNVASPLRLLHAAKDEVTSRVTELLELVGLSELAKAYPHQLSGGQKQRVGIARAQANHPKVLLCDEATSALDPETTDSILDLLLDINRRLGLTIVFVTHEMHVIQKMCDRAAVMEHGRIIEQGTVLELFTHPRTHTAKRFIRTIVDTRLPDRLLRELKETGGCYRIVRIGFVGTSVVQPWISELTAKFRIQPNILYGNILEIKNTLCGNMVIQFNGPRESVLSVLDFLKDKGMDIEEIFSDWSGQQADADEALVKVSNG